MLKRLYKNLDRLYLSPILISEWKKPLFNFKNERPIEYGFVFKCLAKIYPQEILDVGTGKSALPHLLATCGFRVTAIDKIKDYWKDGLFNRHYYIVNDDITNPKIEKQFDFITCISVLEHIPNHKAAVRGIFKLLKPKGYLLLTFPYNEEQYVDNAYNLPEAGYGQNLPYVCQIFSQKEIDYYQSRYEEVTNVPLPRSLTVEEYSRLHKTQGRSRVCV